MSDFRLKSLIRLTTYFIVKDEENANYYPARRYFDNR